MNKTLDMALKGVYLEAVRMGVKKQEYRDMTDYWTNKLVDVESYNMDVRDVMDGLHDGTLELRKRDWTHILFHESGSGKTLLVEVKDIKCFRGHHGFVIYLGNVVKDQKNISVINKKR